MRQPVTSRRVLAGLAGWVLGALCLGNAHAQASASERWDRWEETRLEGRLHRPAQELADLKVMIEKSRGGADASLYWSALGALLNVVVILRSEPISPWELQAGRELVRARASNDVLGRANLLLGLAHHRIYEYRIAESLALSAEARQLGERLAMPGLVHSADFMESLALLQSGQLLKAIQLSQATEHEAGLPMLRRFGAFRRFYIEARLSRTATDAPRLQAAFEKLGAEADAKRMLFLSVRIAWEMHRLLLLQQRRTEADALLKAWQTNTSALGEDAAVHLQMQRWARAAAMDAGQWSACLSIQAQIAPAELLSYRVEDLSSRARCRAARKDVDARQDLPALEALLPQLDEAPIRQEELYELLERTYASLGDYEKAYGLGLKKWALTAKRFAAANNMARHEAETKYDLAAKEKEAALLKVQEQLQTQRRDAFAWGLALVALALCGVAVLLYRQIRQRRRLAEVSERLQSTVDELARLNASRTRLVAAACHDLRQPAHALGLMAEAAAAKSTGEGRALVEAIRNSSTRLSELLDALFDLSRLESDRYTPSIGPVSLAQLFNDLRTQFTMTALRKGLTLRIDDVQATVLSDAHLLQRMVMNLLSNAIKYTAQGTVHIAAARVGDEWELRVEDTGPGIPRDQQAAVFSEFVRLDTSAGTDGLGIGLAVVNRSAALLGHRLALVSEVGKGSCFTLGLPAVATQPVAEDTPGTARGQDQLIGVVDDDEEIRLAMEEFLRLRGYRVRAAPSLDALQKQLEDAREGPPDVVLSDLHLGTGDSLEALGSLVSAGGAWENSQAVLITGDLNPAVQAQCEALGIQVAYKPLPARKLAQLVERLLEARDAALCRAGS